MTYRALKGKSDGQPTRWLTRLSFLTCHFYNLLSSALYTQKRHFEECRRLALLHWFCVRTTVGLPTSFKTPPFVLCRVMSFLVEISLLYILNKVIYFNVWFLTQNGCHHASPRCSLCSPEHLHLHWGHLLSKDVPSFPSYSGRITPTLTERNGDIRKRKVQLTIELKNAKEQSCVSKRERIYFCRERERKGRRKDKV